MTATQILIIYYAIMPPCLIFDAFYRGFMGYMVGK